MTNLEIELTLRLDQLRDSFDRTFALPAAGHIEYTEEFLIVGTDGANCAMQMNALSGLLKGRKVVSLPVRVAGLLGLAGFRGHLIPVFSLASLLGYGSPTGPPAWLAICKADEAIALAFDRFYGSARVAAQDIFQEEPAPGTVHVSRRSFRSETGIVRIIDVPSVVASACERLRQS